MTADETRHEALCHRIAATACALRTSSLRGALLFEAADRLEEAMTAVEEQRLDDAAAALGKLDVVSISRAAPGARGTPLT